ncbi:MAG: metal dependent phosphohydrolase [Bacilli bacterium]|nr:metal dependent phosphohydrolase [Bacilli bacterium]
MRIRDIITPASAFVLPFLLFEYLRMHSSIDLLINAPARHFYIVSSVAILATIIAIAVGVSGSRLRNIQVSFLALAFISLAETFAVHGLSTPNFMLHLAHLPGISAQLSVFLAAFWLYMSSLPSDVALIVWLSRFKSYLVLIWTFALGLLCLLTILWPHLSEHLPLDHNPLQFFVTVVITLLFAATIYRYYQSYRYSRFPLQISIVYSCCGLLVAQFIIASGEVWRLSWWLYHFLLLGSMLTMLVGLYKQYAERQSMVLAIKALFTNDPMERVTNCISPSVRALVKATEVKDTYTAGHNVRVTMYALKLAEEMQLTPEQLRAVSQGSIVHDVGKISIPDQVLNKPGKLTQDERDVIEMHPVTGFDMCKNLGFMKEELDIIRSHHEKWDGSGYPDRLAGEQIPLLSRIVAVADVYDALTSNRAYRKAWTHSETVKFLDANKGTHFDPNCVDVWVHACERDPQIYQYPASLANEADEMVHNGSRKQPYLE